MTTEKQ